MGRVKGRGGWWEREKKNTPVSLNWLGEVIEEGLPQSMQKSLIFLFSMVWQLNRLEMTLSFSQARIGDTLKLTIADTHGFCSQMHMHARPPVFCWEKFCKTPFLTAGTLTMAQPPEWRGKNKDLFLTVCFSFLQLARLLQLDSKHQSGLRMIVSLKKV